MCVCGGGGAEAEPAGLAAFPPTHTLTLPPPLLIDRPCSDPAPFASLKAHYGPPSDVYSFGLMAWEVLTGERVR